MSDKIDGMEPFAYLAAGARRLPQGIPQTGPTLCYPGTASRQPELRWCVDAACIALSAIVIQLAMGPEPRPDRRPHVSLELAENRFQGRSVRDVRGNHAGAFQRNFERRRAFLLCEHLQAGESLDTPE